jgi:hypothetical protein
MGLNDLAVQRPFIYIYIDIFNVLKGEVFWNNCFPVFSVNEELRFTERGTPRHKRGGAPTVNILTYNFNNKKKIISFGVQISHSRNVTTLSVWLAIATLPLKALLTSKHDHTFLLWFPFRTHIQTQWQSGRDWTIILIQLWLLLQ